MKLLPENGTLFLLGSRKVGRVRLKIQLLKEYFCNCGETLASVDPRQAKEDANSLPYTSPALNAREQGTEMPTRRCHLKTPNTILNYLPLTSILWMTFLHITGIYINGTWKGIKKKCEFICPPPKFMESQRKDFRAAWSQAPSLTRPLFSSSLGQKDNIGCDTASAPCCFIFYIFCVGSSSAFRIKLIDLCQLHLR